MTTKRVYFGWCHIKRDAGNPGNWIAYTPEFDVSSTADNPNQAWQDLRAALGTLILDDLASSTDPRLRRSGNASDWDGIDTVLSGYSVYERDESNSVGADEYIIPVTTIVELGPPMSILGDETIMLYERLFAYTNPE